MHTRQKTYHFQPIVHLDSLTLERYEALLRVKGVNHIAEHIQSIQASGMGVNLDIDTLNHVTALSKSLPITARKPIAVNICPNSLLDKSFRERSISILMQNSPLSLSFELTEDAPVEDTPEIRDYLNSVQQMGISVGLDDLGDGFAQLDIVNTFNLDYIKLSERLTTHLLSSAKVREMIKDIMNQISGTTVTVVAEHVDNIPQYQWLREAGVHYGQGWLFAKAGQIIHDVPAFEASIRAQMN